MNIRIKQTFLVLLIFWYSGGPPIQKLQEILRQLRNDAEVGQARTEVKGGIMSRVPVDVSEQTVIQMRQGVYHIEWFQPVHLTLDIREITRPGVFPIREFMIDIMSRDGPYDRYERYWAAIHAGSRWLFLQDGPDSWRRISPHSRPQLWFYVENLINQGFEQTGDNQIVERI